MTIKFNHHPSKIAVLACFNFSWVRMSDKLATARQLLLQHFPFFKRKKHFLCLSVLAHPWLIRQKVIPHDGGPASRQLAHIGNDHQWQRTRLMEKKIHIHNKQFAAATKDSRTSNKIYATSNLQVDGEALHREASLKTERVKFLCHREQTLQNTQTQNSTLHHGHSNYEAHWVQQF